MQYLTVTGNGMQHFGDQCDQRIILGRQFLLVFILLHAITEIPEGVFVGFYIFAWAPHSQKYKDSNP